LIEQSLFFQNKFENYTSFSNSTINNILDDNLKKRLELKLFVNTVSSCILWNETGKFRWEKLPEEVQVSPVKKMIVFDLNNDKYPDVIIAGNDYTWDVSTGYFDSLKGIILLNEGSNRSFSVIPPSRSGLFLQGMVGSLLFYEGDTSLLIGGINRGKAVVFQLK